MKKRHYQFQAIGSEPLENEFFLPDFCNVRMVFAVVIIGELLAIVLALAPFDHGRSRWEDLAMISLFIQWVALISTGVLCVSRPWLRKLNDRQAATYSYFLLLITTTLVSETTYWTSQWVSVEPSHPLIWHIDFLLSNLGICAIISAVVLRYFYIQFQWGRHLQANSQARIQALQARIRPHFLFNSLNTIASLTASHPHEAEEAILDLADLFRETLADTNFEARLSDEVNVAKRYLRIEKLRLGDRLQIDWSLDSIPLNALIPQLTLQPLIENAIYHGIEHIRGGGTILIAGTYANDTITITIANPTTQGKNNNQRASNKMAQENVKLRLATLYGDEGILRVQQTEQSYQISISFPYLEERE